MHEQNQVEHESLARRHQRRDEEEPPIGEGEELFGVAIRREIGREADSAFIDHIDIETDNGQFISEQLTNRIYHN